MPGLLPPEGREPAFARDLPKTTVGSGPNTWRGDSGGVASPLFAGNLTSMEPRARTSVVRYGVNDVGTALSSRCTAVLG
jgi:hypothetical protein